MNHNPFFITAITLNKSLISLKNIIAKVPEFATSKGLTEEQVLDMKLTPDMFNLTKQVQIAADNAKFFASSMGGVEAPKNADVETTVDELVARLDSTLKFMDSVEETSYNDAHTRTKTFGFAPGMYLEAEDYLIKFSVPNFYFHMTTAYCILRANGMQLGKSDFTGGMDLKPL